MTNWVTFSWTLCVLLFFSYVLVLAAFKVKAGHWVKFKIALIKWRKVQIRPRRKWNAAARIRVGTRRFGSERTGQEVGQPDETWGRRSNKENKMKRPGLRACCSGSVGPGRNSVQRCVSPLWLRDVWTPSSPQAEVRRSRFKRETPPRLALRTHPLLK